MSIETIVVQILTDGPTAVSPSQLNDGLITGATYIDAESATESFGDVEYSSNRGTVRINRTPMTQENFKSGRIVKWRDEFWRIEDRNETRGRTTYDLSLGRAE